MPTLPLSDVNLYYEEDGDGPPLLLLHGLGSSTRDWEMQVPDLARHFRLILLDFRGHGRSSRPIGPYPVPLLAEDVVQALDRLGIGPVHVLGLSLGGMVGLHLAVHHPAMVVRLVVTNTASEVVPRSFGQWLQLKERLIAARLLSARSVGRMIGRRLFPKVEQRALRREFELRWGRNDRRGYSYALQGLAGWTITERLGEVRAPTLVVAGERDHLPLLPAAELARRIPGAQLVVVPDSGHATPIDQAGVFNELVLRFLTNGSG